MAAADDIKDISTRGALVAIAISTLVIATVTTFGIFGGYAGGTPDDDKYQAVTLTSGATFYGQLSGVGNEYVTLSNAYTIQNAAQNQTASPQPQLAERSATTFYKPVPAMRISSDQILVWEDLEDDSPVTEAINQQSEEK